MKKRIAALLLCLVLAAAVIAVGEARVHAEGEQYTVTFHRNDGSGSPVYHTVTVAPGEAAAFPADPTRPGFIFKGWYDTPIVETPLKEDNSIKSLTPTGDTTLYALWMDERLNIPIGIGINLRYHCEGATYWYPGIGQALNAYQTLPNEPATIEHAALRTWKKDGAWIILSNNNEQENGLGNDYYSARLGVAGDYVRWDFFTSPDMHPASDGTFGIADASGGKVRAMLSLTQEDYDAIAAGWIAWAKDPVNSFSSGEGYNDGWNNKALSKIDWQDPGIVASDYKAVPYVLKYQTRNNILVWFIDMIIAPKNKYTLSYDRNLDFGFSLPENQVFPQNETYKEGEIASVVLDPNVTPTNGNKVAIFQYWVDADGNRYGKDDITSIPMWSDKVLYAIWAYPDEPQLGSLRVNKNVTNVGNITQTHENASFSFSITLKDTQGTALNDVGNIACRIYNANSQLMEEKTLATWDTDGDGTANNTFSLRDDWYAILDRLPRDTVCTVDETPPAGYYAVGLPRQVTIVADNTVYVDVENLYAPDGFHIIEHYFENKPGQYPAQPDIRETGSGSGTDELDDLVPKTADHYTYVPAKTTVTTRADGVKVYKLYYDRTRYPNAVWYREETADGPLLRAPELHPGDILGTAVVEKAPQIPGYTVLEPAEHILTIREEKDGADDVNDIVNNVTTFLYRLNALTITRTNAADPEQVFVYEVKNNETGEIVTVTVVGNCSTTIHGLPYGSYTVTQVGDWSWRYDDGAKNAQLSAANGGRDGVSFGNTASDYWLDGYSPQIDNRKKEGGA